VSPNSPTGASIEKEEPMKKNLLRHASLSVLVVTLCTGANAAHPGSSIAETAAKAGTFGTLLKAAEVAGLSETLSGHGALTVFAPSDDAFAKLPEGTVAGLLENPERLRTVLLYHIVDGKVGAADVGGLKTAKSLMGQSLAVDASDGVRINNAKVTKADITCSNGVIHVVDTVLIPKDIVDIAAGADGFKTLVTALKAAGLVDTLKGDGPFTVFAPTDDAFAKLPSGTIPMLLQPENKAKLTAILTNHVVAGSVMAEQAVTLPSAKTLGGSDLPITVKKDQSGKVVGVQIGGANIVQTDIVGLNGVIHVIDTVLVP
jgi:transforming growth factor-beta-induced protein